MISLSHRLTALAEAGRTGALHVGGTPGGVVYLVAGRITHAESPACPGIGERLVGCGRLSEAQWHAAYEAGHGTRNVGRVLLLAGHLGHHELACRVVATITAATHALMQGDDAPMCFVPGERHWFGTVAQADLGNLGPETARRLRARPTPRGPRSLRCFSALAGARMSIENHDAQRVRL